MKIEIEKLGNLLTFENKTKKRASEGKSKGKYLFFTSSPIQNKNIDNYDFEGEYIILGTGGVPSLHYCNDKFSVSADCLVASVKNIVKTKYLFYYLKSHLSLIERTFRGSGLKHTSKDRLSVIEIKYPSEINEQEDIISLFERLYSINDKMLQLLFLKDIFLKNLYYNLFVNPTTNTKWFPEVKLGEICYISMGGTPSTKKPEYWNNGTINWMKSGDIKGDFIGLIPQKITPIGLKNSNAKMYKKGNVVIALNGQGKTRGTTGILMVDTTSNQSVASFSPSSKINNIYLNFNLKYRYQEIRDLTGDKQRSGLNLNILRNLKIQLPPIELQNKFASFIIKLKNIKEKQDYLFIELNRLNSIIERRLLNY